jgi:inosine/xanthosine triphosphatase
MIIVAVGTTNPSKLQAVRTAMKKLKKPFQIKSVEVESGISPQPMTDEETKKGSLNRASRALQKMPIAEISIGIEGGVEKTKDGLMNSVWVCLISKEKKTFFVNGNRFLLPVSIASRIFKGEEMGKAVDVLTHESDVNKKHGMIGVITRNYVKRAESDSSVVQLAIGQWYGDGWEKDYL